MTNNSITLLAFLGDIMLGRGVNALIPLHDPEHFWGTTLPVLRSTDVVFGNLECAMTSHTQPWNKTFKVFHFRASPQAVNALKVANIQVVSLANNHTLDFEEKGLLDTLKHLDQAGIKHAGAGKNLSEARAPAILTVKGLKIAFIAATDNEPPFAAGERKPGTNYLEINTRPAALAHLYEDIKQAKERGARFIILSLHWGPNMVQTPTSEFKAFAHKAIEMGVDVIYGHSAHLFQGIEFYKSGVILYNTGDFLDDYATDPVLRNDWSFIFLLKLEDNSIKKVQAIPVRLNYAQTNLAKGEESEEIMSRMGRLSEAFGTKSEKVGTTLEFSPGRK